MTQIGQIITDEISVLIINICVISVLLF